MSELHVGATGYFTEVGAQVSNKLVERRPSGNANETTSRFYYLLTETVRM